MGHSLCGQAMGMFPVSGAMGMFPEKGRMLFFLPFLSGVFFGCSVITATFSVRRYTYKYTSQVGHGVRRCATSCFDPWGEVLVGAEAQIHRRCGGRADP